MDVLLLSDNVSTAGNIEQNSLCIFSHMSCSWNSSPSGQVLMVLVVGLSVS